jgi:hypothetical protein
VERSHGSQSSVCSFNCLLILATYKTSDSRIPALIRNGVQEKKRSFIVVVGDRSKDVIVHLHYIMSSMDVKQNKSVLWAYKNKLLGFTRCAVSTIHFYGDMLMIWI